MAILDVPYVFTPSRLGTCAPDADPLYLIGFSPVRVCTVPAYAAPLVSKGVFPTTRFVRRCGAVVREPYLLQTDYRTYRGRLMRKASLDATLIGDALLKERRAGRPLPPLAWPALNAALCETRCDGFVSQGLSVSALYLAGFAMSLGGPELLPRAPGLEPLASSLHLDTRQNVVGLDHGDKSLRSLEAVEQFQTASAFIDGSLYVPSSGPGWLCRRIGDSVRARAVPEAFHVHGHGPDAFFSCGQEDLLSTICQRDRLSITYEGRISVSDQDNLDPDAVLIQSAAKRASTPEVCAALCQAGSPEGLRKVADLLQVLVEGASPVDVVLPLLRGLAIELRALTYTGAVLGKMLVEIEKCLSRYDMRKGQFHRSISTLEKRA